jgi:hypothetical protein
MIQKQLVVILALAGVASFTQLATAQEPACGSVCPATCAPKVCKPITVPTTVTERTYSDTCEEFCRPTCSWFGLFGGGCNCKDGSCGKVATKKYLVVHIRTHQECEKKCVVETATPCVGAPATVIGAPVPTGPVPTPLPQPK